MVADTIVFKGLTVKDVLSVVVPHSLVTESEIVFNPTLENVVAAGVKSVELNPKGLLVHKYVIGLSPQLLTKVDGVTVYGIQPSSIGNRFNMGACFITTVSEVGKVPHVLVTSRVIV